MRRKRKLSNVYSIVFFIVILFKVHIVTSYENEEQHDDNNTSTTTTAGTSSHDDERDNSKIKIVGFTDETLLPAAIIWYDRLTELGYDEHVIVAVDVRTYLYCKSLPGNIRVELYPVNEEGKHTWKKGVQTFRRRLFKARIMYSYAQILNGHSILLTDVDNIFINYFPLSKLENSVYDVYHAYGMKHPPAIRKKYGFAVCGGMIYYTANDRTLQYLSYQFAECISVNGCDDQVAVNTVLHERSHIKWNYTDDHMRPTGKLVNSTDQLMNDELIVSLTGYSETIKDGLQQPLRVKVWDRNFAFRGSFRMERSICPPMNENWVTMPSNVPFNPRRKGYSDIVERIARIPLWYEMCGVNNSDKKE